MSKRSFKVEKRTRVVDEGKPPVGENIKIAVYTEVNGKLVYCGTSRSGCKKEIFNASKGPGSSEFEGGD